MICLQEKKISLEVVPMFDLILIKLSKYSNPSIFLTLDFFNASIFLTTSVKKCMKKNVNNGVYLCMREKHCLIK